MVTPRDPVFLARETYRRRRLIDALRLLPVIALLLFLAPLIGGSGQVRATAYGGMFVFASWFGLILAAFVLVRLLGPAPGQGIHADPREPDHGAAGPHPPDTAFDPQPTSDPDPPVSR